MKKIVVKSRVVIVASFALPWLLVATARGAEVETPLRVEISPQAAAPVVLDFGATHVALKAEGGFAIYDATARRAVGLGEGTITTRQGATVFDARGADLRLHAEFNRVGDRIEVQGVMENLGQNDRGLILDYRIPLWSPSAYFSNALDEKISLPQGSREGNVYPVAAMGAEQVALGAAIPPSQPCVFGLSGSSTGLTVRFYLGMSALPRRFPNQANFAFVLYAIDPAAGFRSALARYYHIYDDYYARRLKSDGLWMFQMSDRVPPNVEQYGFDEVEPSAAPAILNAAIARDVKSGIPVFPYTIVGQREIKHLPKLPQSYQAVLDILKTWDPTAAGQTVSKEDVSKESLARVKEEIESSACQTSDARYALVLRNTTWGGNSATFKINPNPDLFSDQDRATVGRDTLATVKQWLEAHPEFKGAYVDSLGANWPATFNYRREHFVYARYPLTFDSEGRVALQNDLSHYEFLTALRTMLRAQGRMVFGNGIYAYKSRGEPAKRVEFQTFDNQLNEFAAGGAPPEHYRPGATIGRFFDAALLDVAGSEAGVNATIARCQDARVFMAQKPYAFLNYQWQDAGKVEELLNKSLCYAIFATSSRNFMTGVEYETNPNGYYRDKALLDWFVPLARRLSRAGWEPVRHATFTGANVSCERFGAGDTVYYTLFNDSATPTTCTLDVNLPALAFDAATARFSEIARATKFSAQSGHVTVELPPKRTLVIQIARAEKSSK